jgi:outer membrane protein
MLPSLSGTASFQRLAFRNTFDFLEGGPWFNVGALGLRLQVPILSLRDMVYTPGEQKIRWRQASYALEHFSEEQHRIYEQERLQLQQAYQVWQRQQKNRELALQNETLTRKKVTQGILDMVQLRQVQDDVNQAQQKLSQARLRYLQHYVNLQYLQAHP